MTDAAPGWYPDPTATAGAPAPLRYWDGWQWTQHVAPAPWAQPVRAAGPTTPDGVPLAGWWHRVGATLVDGVFATIVSVILTIPAQVRIERQTQELADQLQRNLENNDPHALSTYFHQFLDLYRGEIWWYVPAIVVVLAGQTAFLHLWGGTPGQLLTRLRTRRRDTPGNLGWGRALVRGLAAQSLPGIVMYAALLTGSIAAIAGCYVLGMIWQLLNPLWAAWDSKRQALHDKVVGTNVVRHG